jgi:hypothetical protein
LCRREIRVEIDRGGGSMVDRSALVRSSYESSRSFEKRLVWVVKCSKCGRVYGDGRCVVYFGSVEEALDAVARSRDWWIVREWGLEVICIECYWKVRGRLEDEVGSGCELLL